MMPPIQRTCAGAIIRRPARDAVLMRRGRLLAAAWCLIAVNVAFAQPKPGTPGTREGVWMPQGPGPIIRGQAEAIQKGEVVGAVHAIAAHPTSADILYIGAVNGGVWRTTNAQAPLVNWTRLTDQESSLSIGALEFDPTIPGGTTLVAGMGRFSSFASLGGARSGLLRTTNGGTTWQAITGGGVLIDKNISGVAARGATLVISVNFAAAFTFGNIGVWRSADGGTSFQQIARGNGSATGLPGGVTHDLGGDPLNPARLFTSVIFADSVGGRNGVYRSEDTGETWTKVSSPEMDALLISGSTSTVEFAVGRHHNVYVAIANGGRLVGVFRSGDDGTAWTRMDLPTSNEGAPIGIHPGGQAGIHLSLVADPADANIVYIGGDRQPLFREGVGGPTSFPNSIGARNFTGRFFRGDASRAAGSQWVHLTHSSTLGAAGGGTASNSSPHADSREMTFDASGNIIEVDDGGVYKRTLPRSNQGDWVSLNGDLQTSEVHDVAYDSNSNLAISGNQDTGTPMQLQPGQTRWDEWQQADGGDVLVDDSSIPDMSVRYSSTQNLGSFNRSFWDASNRFVASAPIPLTPLGGVPRPTGTFVTPLALNSVDATRLIIGGGNGVYESLDRGDTVSRVATTVVNSGGVDPIAYGAADNPDILYIGATNRVFVRLGPAPAPLQQALTFPAPTGQTVSDIVVNPADGDTAFAVTPSAIYKTTDAGATWTDITGNLQTFTPSTLRSLAYVSASRGDGIAVGTQTGVFFATAGSGFAGWRRLGSGLPRVPVFDLDYDREDGVLVAGTFGRGVWKILVAADAAGGAR